MVAAFAIASPWASGIVSQTAVINAFIVFGSSLPMRLLLKSESLDHAVIFRTSRGHVRVPIRVVLIIEKIGS